MGKNGTSIYTFIAPNIAISVCTTLLTVSRTKDCPNIELEDQSKLQPVLDLVAGAYPNAVLRERRS
jgi:hypothetical protein